MVWHWELCTKLISKQEHVQPRKYPNHYITTLWLYQLWESDNVNLANLSLGSEWELNRWRARTVTYKFVGIKITTSDRWKQVAIEKTYENKHKVKEIYLLSKPFTINITWRIVCKKILKNHLNFTSRVTLIHQNVLFWKITQCFILKLKKIYCNH